MDLSWRRLFVLTLACLLAGSSSFGLQTQPRNVAAGVYTEQQATRGQALYKARCSSCHGDNLGGRVGPALAGDDFLAGWASQSLLELANKIRLTMPRDESPRLSTQETADVVAYMLQAGKFPAGRNELSADDAALKQVTFSAKPVSPAQTSIAAAQLPSLPPSGNLAQVMRGILFPSSNIIFTVQGVDPGVKRPATADNTTAAGGFDWFTWGGGIYPGWDVVDYAAVSLAESATLMFTPGRRCENGRLVPVSDPDWIKFSLELAEAGRAAYKASQTRNQETVSEFTNQLNDSCMNCHRVFRGRTHCVKP